VGWWGTILKNRAAKQYARRLPRALAEGWGGSKFYTRPQIETAVRSIRLNPRYIVLAYAAYLPEDQFEDVLPSAPLWLTYREARELFRDWLPRHSPFNPASDASAGAYASDTGAGDGGGHH
jgi:hypothetical protein